MNFTAEFHFARCNIVAAVKFATKKQHFLTSVVFFEEPWLPLLFYVLRTTSWLKIFPDATTEKLSSHSRIRNLSFHLKSNIFSHFLFIKSEAERICVHLQLLPFADVTRPVDKINMNPLFFTLEREKFDKNISHEFLLPSHVLPCKNGGFVF